MQKKDDDDRPAQMPRRILPILRSLQFENNPFASLDCYTISSGFITHSNGQTYLLYERDRVIDILWGLPINFQNLVIFPQP